MREKTRVKPIQRSRRRAEAPGQFFPRAQPKLTVGPRRDRFEAEADRIADRVVAKPAEIGGGPVVDHVTPRVQRTTDDEVIRREDDSELAQATLEEELQAKGVEETGAEREEESQPKAEEEAQTNAEEEAQSKSEVGADAERDEDAQTGGVQRLAGSDRPHAAPNEAGAVLRRVRGTGGPLPSAVRARMGRAFGADFADVRVHRSGMAERLAWMLGARAFALGRDLFFGPGAFRPGSRGGDHLLAHELTHTIQQGAVRRAEPRSDSRPPADAARGGAPAVSREQGAGAPRPDLRAPGSPITGPRKQADDSAAPPAAAPDSGATTSSEVSVNAPPAPPIPETKIDTVEPVALEGSSSEAFAKFAGASASQMAATQPKLGGALQQKVASEQRAEAASAPDLTTRMSGKDDVALVKPRDLPPGSPGLGDGRVGPDAPPLNPEPQTNRGAPPNNSAAADAIPTNADDAEVVAKAQAAMRRVITNDPNIVTSAGPAPSVDTSGDADPGRAARQTREASGQARSQRDETAKSLREHPGQSNVQPKAVEKTNAVELAAEPAETIETTPTPAAEDYRAAPLTADVRAKADEMLAPTLGANLNESKTKAIEAAATRDREKRAKIDEAKRQTDKINEQADRDQRAEVTRQRTAIAKQQRQGIDEANTHVAAFEKGAGKERAATDDAVRARSKQAEADSRKELDQGERKAEDERKRGEAEAAREKARAEKEQKNQSWWDRAKSAIKSAIKALTSVIDKIFTAVRNAVKKVIEAARKLAVGIINAARKWVVDKLNKFREWAKKAVNALLKDTFPGLAKKINKAIDAVVDVAIAGVNKIADAAVAAVNALAKGLAAALDKVLSTFQTGLKAAVQIAGAVLTGDLAGALRIAIEAACSIAGVSPKPIFDFIDRAAANVMRILRHPVKFFDNLVGAVGQGVRGFLTNIKQHLIQGVIAWLTGALSATPIRPPEKFDFRGVVSLALQILGLTYDNIKARVIRKYPKAEKVFGVLETSVEVVRGIVTEGPVFLWRWIQESVSNLKEQVIGGIRNMLITTVIEQGVVWLLSLLNPAGAIARVVKLLFDVVRFLIERFEQIKQFVLSVYNAVAEIAAGKLAPAAKAVEGALARSLPVVIGLMASILGLGGLGRKVQKLIGTITKPINKVLDKVIDKIVAAAKKLIKKGKAGAKKVAEKLAQWWKARRRFKADNGEPHSIQFRGSGDSSKLTLKSEERTVEAFLAAIKPDLTPETKPHYENARSIAAQIDAKKKEPLGADPEKKKLKAKQKQKDVEALFAKMEVPFRSLLGLDNVPAWQEPDYDTSPSPFSKHMHAKVLSKEKMGKGSAPSSAGDAWNELLVRRSGGGSYYIRGHLLNDNLGGPGVWKNMTPLSREGNSAHEKSVESKVKNAVNAGGIVSYSVIPVYAPRGGGDAIVAALNRGATDDQAGRIKKLVKREDNVPSGLRIKAEMIRPAGAGRFETIKSLYSGTLDNPVDRDASSYQLDGVERIEPVALGSGLGAAESSALRARIRPESDVGLLERALADRTKTFGTYERLAVALNSVQAGAPQQDGGAFTSKVGLWRDRGFIKLR